MPVAPGGEADRGARPEARARGPQTKLLGYDHNWSEHPDDVANTPPGEDPETEYPYRPAQQRAPAAGSPAPRTTATPATRARQTELHDALPAQGHLVHRVLRLARRRPTRRRRSSPTRSSGTRATSCSASPATGARPSSTGTSRSTRPAARTTAAATPAPACSRSARATASTNAEYFTLGHLARFVKPGAVRIASTLVRHDRLERADHGRRVPQPRRLDRARRPQRERRPAHVRGRRRAASPSTTRCPAARWRRSPGRAATSWTTATTC